MEVFSFHLLPASFNAVVEHFRLTENLLKFRSGPVENKQNRHPAFEHMLRVLLEVRQMKTHAAESQLKEQLKAMWTK